MGGYVKSLLHATAVLAEKSITWAWSNEYASHVANAREITLNGSNQNEIKNSKPFKGELTYDKLFWIDSDIIFTPEDVLKLYESDKDIVTGAYYIGNGEVTAYKEKLGRPYTIEEVQNMTELTKIHSAGFGFICIKSGVFESLSRPWFQSVPVTMVDDETKEEFTFPIMGEDVSFCHRANNAGFEVWLDPSVKLIHHKTMRLTWEGIGA